MTAMLSLLNVAAIAQSYYNGELWPDTGGVHINAHGGGILYHGGKYYWFGEHKSEHTSAALVGVTCYSSTDLHKWTNEGIALPVSGDPESPITKGCVIERPKVIYNKVTGKFVMWFHLELKGKGYGAAYAALAVSDNATGPYRFVRAGRVNPGIYPQNMTEENRRVSYNTQQKSWTPEWVDDVKRGMLVERDVEGGQMSRDMTLYVDDDGKAYHIYSSEENLTLHIAELSDDYQSHTGKYVRVAPAGHNEAPALFKKDGTYWMITSGCTGWTPNEARMFSATSIWGPWTQHPNPCRGEKAEITFGAQSTFILSLPDNKGFIFMADIWRPKTPIDARYLWLPVRFDESGKPFLRQEASDRQYWSALLYKMAAPVLSNMGEGKLQQNMLVEVSPSWDGRDRRVTYMEAFGRLMAGLAPWLSLPDDDTEEGKKRKELRGWALKSYAHAVDPQSPDYLLWRNEGQPMVDAAYIANSFLRAPKQLWEPLDEQTKQRYITEFQQLRRIDTPYTNWLLFSAMIETFLLSVDAQYDQYRIHSAIRKIEEWYVGDGWYSDGERFAFDYYNSYVIQTMYVEVLQVLVDKKVRLRDKSLDAVKRNLEAAQKRMQRFGVILERLISPEGALPLFGRSITYRTGILQPLALLALNETLPGSLPGGQVRAAMTAAIKRIFPTGTTNFNEKGYLTLGFCGSQPDISDSYTNNGSMYLASLAFLPLGLPADHPFWTDEPLPWTTKKAYDGMNFPKDKAYHE